VPGWDFFYEHVHLTFEGNCLLARIFAEKIEKLLPQSATDSRADWPTVPECARRLGRSDRDLRSALAEILGRLTDPPFITQINHDEQVRFLAKRAGEAPLTVAVAGALQIAQAAVKAAPDDARLYQQFSNLEEAVGHQAEAEAAARRAVDLLPSSAEAWSQLGSIFVQQKKYEDAANTYQQAFKLNEQDVWPLQNRAVALTKLGRNSDAAKEYKRALAITPRFGLAWLGLGQLLEQKGDQDAAADCYKKALQNRIHRAPELATLARFCMSRKWFDAATTNFDEAIKLDPTNPSLVQEAGEAHFFLGRELGNSGHADQAAREFREAARLMPEVIEARLNLAIALFKGKQWDESQQIFQQVISRCPTNALAQHYLDLLGNRAVTPP